MGTYRNQSLSNAALDNAIGSLVKTVSPNGRAHYARLVGWEPHNANESGCLLHLKPEYSLAWIPIRKGHINIRDPHWVTEWDVKEAK